MYKFDKDLRSKLRSPAIVVFAVSLIILIINILYIGKIRPFNSDDLYWQLAVQTWVPFSGHTLYLATKDIFVEQVPFFFVMEHVFSPGRKLLIFEAGILTVSTFVLTYLSTLYFLKKLRIKLTFITLLPFVWLASFGYPLVQNYLNSDWRTFEVGLSIATFTLAAAVCFKDIKPPSSWRSRILMFTIALTMGWLVYSDPYYTFFTIAPLSLFCTALFVLNKISRQQFLTIVSVIAIAMLASKVIGKIYSLAGVVIVTDIPSEFVNFDNIITNVVSSMHGLLLVYGADFFGRPAITVSAFIALTNALLLAFLLYKTVSVIRSTKMKMLQSSSLERLWENYFAYLMVFVFVLYTLTTLVLVSNYRFFIIFVYASVMFFAMVLGSSRNKLIRSGIGLLLVAAALFNIVYTLFSNNILLQPGVAQNQGNAQNYEIIKNLEASGLTKGYGSYWQANTTTYLSDRRVLILPTICYMGTTHLFPWLVDGSQFETTSQKSFYVLDPDFAAPPVCTEEQLLRQFGDPVKIIDVGNKKILTFNYDIKERMTLFRSFD